jgi:hypothetical protein
VQGTPAAAALAAVYQQQLQKAMLLQQQQQAAAAQGAVTTPNLTPQQIQQLLQACNVLRAGRRSRNTATPRAGVESRKAGARNSLR